MPLVLLVKNWWKIQISVGILYVLYVLSVLFLDLQSPFTDGSPERFSILVNLLLDYGMLRWLYFCFNPSCYTACRSKIYIRERYHCEEYRLLNYADGSTNSSIHWFHLRKPRIQSSQQRVRQQHKLCFANDVSLPGKLRVWKPFLYDIVDLMASFKLVFCQYAGIPVFGRILRHL